jgi:hypothetical protein
MDTKVAEAELSRLAVQSMADTYPFEARDLTDNFQQMQVEGPFADERRTAPLSRVVASATRIPSTWAPGWDID